MACYTWITKRDGKVLNICQTGEDKSPGPEWEKVPNDWGGNLEDDLTWFDANMRRIPDQELIDAGKRIDKRGKWFNKKDIGETKIIYSLDEEPGEGWTQKEPLIEPYQKWDEDSDSWIIDEAKKEEAEKQQRIAEKQAAIKDAEQRIQRSLIAREAKIATEEDDTYFNQISAEILSLREELRGLTAA
jgi:hypothetical protein